MKDFGFFFKLGWEHIISSDALDHQLFIIALLCMYSISRWKQVLVLITAFTVGHFITLLLSISNIVKMPGAWVEFLIPLTIVITAVSNLFYKERNTGNGFRYVMAAFFGLIHGLGFANYIRFILSKEESLFWPLLGFNTGLEAGQVVVAAILLAILYFIGRASAKAFNYSPIIVSVITAIWALVFAIQRFPS